MIRQVRGKVLEAGPASVIVEVAGFGLEVRTIAPETYAPGVEVVLATHMALRQDGIELYGFAQASDRDFFEKLLRTPGVGPKTALSILRRAPRAAIANAIAARDLSYLTRVVGVGKKMAEKMLAELSEKITGGNHATEDSEVFDTLIALGYTEREARTALQSVPEGISGKDERLRAALSPR
jgi:Holliday junction DNA helicase RuvA